MPSNAHSTRRRKSDSHQILHPVTNPNQLDENRSLVIERGRGPYVYNVDGREYLDGMAGLWNVNVGYGREELATAAEEQMKKLAYAPLFWGRGSAASEELAEKLGTLFPESLGLFHFTSGGSESNESAFKIARYYWRLKGKPQKDTIVSCSLGYHGVSMGALGATGLSHFVDPFGERPRGYAQIPSPYCYHCPLGKDYPECEIACAHELDKLVREKGADKIAAFIVEPVEGAGGLIVPPPEYLAVVHEICRTNEILLILDEVITGFGRTGTMFAFQKQDFVPDMVSMAKGISSGYIPFGAVALSKEIHGEIMRADRIFFHGFTYSGHPVGCAVAMKNIEIIEKEGLCENAARQGTLMADRLKQELGSHPRLGGFRQSGLMGAFEIVEDKERARRFPAQEKMGEKVAVAAKDAGLLIRPIGDIIAFAPPLILTERHVEQMVERLKTAVQKVLGS